MVYGYFPFANKERAKMIVKTITRTQPYLCTLCGGNGIDPRVLGYGEVTPQCPECKGTGILYIEVVETWNDVDGVEK